MRDLCAIPSDISTIEVDGQGNNLHEPPNTNLHNQKAISQSYGGSNPTFCETHEYRSYCSTTLAYI